MRHFDGRPNARSRNEHASARLRRNLAWSHHPIAPGLIWKVLRRLVCRTRGSRPFALGLVAQMHSKCDCSAEAVGISLVFAAVNTGCYRMITQKARKSLAVQGDRNCILRHRFLLK